METLQIICGTVLGLLGLMMVSVRKLEELVLTEGHEDPQFYPVTQTLGLILLISAVILIAS